jgi:ABC-type antimicrobial peptide transport system permease subunit
MTESDMLTDPTDSTRLGVAIINEALAKKYFEGENPVGRWVSSGFGPGRLQVIAVTGNVAEGGLTDAPAPVRYVPITSLTFTSQSQSLVFKVAGNQDLLPFLETVRQTITEASPRVAIAQSTTMDLEVARAVGPVRQVMTLVSLLTGLALLLGAIGIYGVMSHFVLRRKRDWGIKIALGLAPRQVVSSVVGRGSSLVAAGIGIGLGGFLLLGRLLRPFIYGIGASDPAAIAIAAVALMLVGVVAAFLPAARAGRTDPAVVFRDQ